MSALFPKNVKCKCSNILPNANFINTVSNSQYLNLRQWVRQQINPIANSPEGKKQQRKQAKEIADNGYLVFMWDKYFATSSHSFCSHTLGALSELWLKCLNIEIYRNYTAWNFCVGRIPDFPRAYTADSQDTSPRLGSVAFQGGTSDTVWGANPAAGSGDCAAWLFCPAAHGTQGHLDDPTCRSPVSTEPFHTHQNPAISDRVALGVITAEPMGAACWTSYWNNLAVETGLLLSVEKEPGTGVSVLDKQNMGPLEAPRTVWVSAAWQDTMAFPDTVFPQTDLFPLKHHCLQEALPTLQVWDLPALS